MYYNDLQKVIFIRTSILGYMVFSLRGVKQLYYRISNIYVVKYIEILDIFGT